MWINRGTWPRASRWNRAAAVAVALLLLLTGCGRRAPAPRPLCGVALPEDEGPWQQVWRSIAGESGVSTLLREGDWLWAATPDDVVRIDLQTLDCTRFTRTEGEPEVPLRGVRALLTDPDGRLWAAGDEGLARFDGVGWRAVLTGVHALSLAFDISGDLWAEISRCPAVLPFRFPGHEPPEDGPWQGERVMSPPGVKQQCEAWIAASPSFGYTDLAFSSPEECWLLSNWRSRIASVPPPEGIILGENVLIAGSEDTSWLLAGEVREEPRPRDVLVRFDGRNWRVFPLGTLPPARPTALVADGARDTVWLATTEGLFSSDGETLQKFLLRPEDRTPVGWQVFDLAVDADGRLWASTAGGLFRYDEPSDIWRSTEITTPVFLSADDRGGLWMVPYFSGFPFGYFDGRGWTFYEFPPRWPCDIAAILADAGGGLWLSSHKCALRGFNGKVWDEYDSGSRGDLLARGPGREVYAAAIDGSVRRWDGERWEVIRPPSRPISQEVTDLAVGPDATVWVAYDRSPFLRRYREGSWSAVPVPVEAAITALLVGSDGTLWAAFNREEPSGTTWVHQQGLMRYDGETWEWSESPVSLGRVTALAEDRHGRIWVGGYSGLSVYEP